MPGTQWEGLTPFQYAKSILPSHTLQCRYLCGCRFVLEILASVCPGMKHNNLSPGAQRGDLKSSMLFFPPKRWAGRRLFISLTAFLAAALYFSLPRSLLLQQWLCELRIKSSGINYSHESCQSKPGEGERKKPARPQKERKHGNKSFQRINLVACVLRTGVHC